MEELALSYLPSYDWSLAEQVGNWWFLVSVMIFGICDDGGYDGGLTIPFVDDVDDSGLVFSALLVEAPPGEEHLPPHHHAWHCHHPHPQYHHHHRRWERCPVVTMFSAATSSVRDFPPTQSLYHHQLFSSSEIWLIKSQSLSPTQLPLPRRISHNTLLRNELTPENLLVWKIWRHMNDQFRGWLGRKVIKNN